MSDIQGRYFQEMHLLKVRICQLEVLIDEAQTVDNRIKIFLAIASNGSIASWAIWQDLSFIWGLIIAASQLINATKKYLPFEKRIPVLSGLVRELESHMILAEKRWFSIADGQVTEEDINKFQVDIKKKKKKSFDKYLSNIILPTKHPRYKEAEETALQYFTNFYGGQHD